MRAWLIAVALLTLSGCTAWYYDSGPAYVGAYVSAPPPGIAVYPHVWYDGGYAYFVHDRWYHHGPDGWVVMQQPPPERYRYRAFVEHRPEGGGGYISNPSARSREGGYVPAAPMRAAPVYRASPAMRAAPVYRASPAPVLRPAPALRPSPMRSPAMLRIHPAAPAAPIRRHR